LVEEVDLSRRMPRLAVAARAGVMVLTGPELDCEAESFGVRDPVGLDLAAAGFFPVLRRFSSNG